MHCSAHAELPGIIAIIVSISFPSFPWRFRWPRRASQPASQSCCSILCHRRGCHHPSILPRYSAISSRRRREEEEEVKVEEALRPNAARLECDGLSSTLHSSVALSVGVAKTRGLVEVANQGGKAEVYHAVSYR